MATDYLTLRLTGREADALHSLLSIVLNDPDWFEDAQRDGPAVGRVSDKLMRALREAAEGA